jgi:hypothetical protein
MFFGGTHLLHVSLRSYFIILRLCLCVRMCLAGFLCNADQKNVQQAENKILLKKILDFFKLILTTHRQEPIQKKIE